VAGYGWPRANAAWRLSERHGGPTIPPAVRRQFDTGRAAGLGLAVLTTNVVALVFTVVFARLLGASGYGSLAALLSSFIILMVPGSALQIETAREVSRATAAGDASAGTDTRLWLRQLALAAVAVAIVAVPLRSLLGAAINVDEHWGAAAVPVTAVLWMLVCVERGALQGFQRYRLVGVSLVAEASFRLLFSGLLVAAGLDVTGAFLGSALSLIAIGLALGVPLHRRLHGKPIGQRKRLGDLLAGSWAPVVGLTLLFALQEVHVIVVKHLASGDAAGSYAVAAVAGKAIIWIAVGLGMYLLPEATRRARLGEDARPILQRTLGLIAVAGVPMVLIYAAVGRQLLGAVFGEDLTAASGALPWLGLAMTLLACSYLSVQYLLALGRARFIWVLVAAAVAEVALLSAVAPHLTGVAVALFGVQLACAASLLTIALRQVRATERAEACLPV
jgi:O-antigen/teichoic acid export membrane protein